MICRRSFITGLVSLVATPAIVRATNLMPVKAMEGIVYKDPYRLSEWLDEPFALPEPCSATQFIEAMAEAQRRLRECTEWRAPFLVSSATYREFIADH